MDELERKIIAHELALIETVAHIGAGLVVGITEEERVIRITAIELLEAALQRFGCPPADVLVACFSQSERGRFGPRAFSLPPFPRDVEAK